uniref:Uncharacterized protein n=1 Tax=Anopheles stephensi TaxID=30069 RepID=A0A182Y7Z3_ANOST
MKFTFAFILFALFAVLAVCQASEDAAVSSEDGGAKPVINVELTNDDGAETPEAKGGLNMKFAFALVLIALIAVIAVCQASEDAASSQNDASANVELTQEEIATIEANAGRSWWWETFKRLIG